MGQKRAVIISTKQDTFSQNALIKSLHKKKIKTSIINPKSYAFGSSQELSAPQFLFHRSLGPYFDDFDLRITEDFAYLGAQIINPLKTLKILRNKAEQSLFFYSQGLPIIPTYFLRGQLNEDHFSSWAKQNKIKSSSLVLKTERGHGGIGTFKINGIDSLSSLWETFSALRDERFIIQPFITACTEYRLFLINGEFFICAQKNLQQQSDFRGNASRLFKNNHWIKINFTKIPKEVIKLVQLISQACPAIYLAIDLFWDPKDGPRIIECNAAPGFEELQKLCTISISDRIISCLS